MKVRQATMAEIPEIMEIYHTARSFMQEHGNKNQWINGYPSRELVERDCRNGHLYVCEEEGELAGVFMFYTEPEPNYHVIYEGEWLNDRPYGTMHRMASSGKVKGVACFCLAWCFEQCGNVKGDTHADNYVMQNVFEKNGFKKCGIIHVENGTPRIAYQKEEKSFQKGIDKLFTKCYVLSAYMTDGSGSNHGEYKPEKPTVWAY